MRARLEASRRQREMPLVGTQTHRLQQAQVGHDGNQDRQRRYRRAVSRAVREQLRQRGQAIGPRRGLGPPRGKTCQLGRQRQRTAHRRHARERRRDALRVARRWARGWGTAHECIALCNCRSGRVGQNARVGLVEAWGEGFCKMFFMRGLCGRGVLASSLDRVLLHCVHGSV